MSKCAQYGKLYQEDVGRIIEAERSFRKENVKNAILLLVWILARVRDGNTLGKRESAILREWLESEGLNIDAKDVQVVQFSRKEASAIFNNHEIEVSRQVKNLIDKGIMLRIGQHAAGHSSLFVMYPEKITSMRVTQTGENRDTSMRVTQTGENRVTSKGEKGNIQAQIGIHHDAVNCAAASYQEVNQEVNQRGAIGSALMEAEQSPITCPECGNRDIVIIANVATCNSCNIAWRTSSRTSTPLQ